LINFPKNAAKVNNLRDSKSGSANFLNNSTAFTIRIIKKVAYQVKNPYLCRF